MAITFILKKSADVVGKRVNTNSGYHTKTSEIQ